MSNHDGKPVFKISLLEQVKRFLILGSETGTYYVSAVDLTKQYIKCLDEILNSNDRHALLDIISEFEDLNKCKKKDTLIYALAKACTFKVSNKEYIQFRRSAYEIMLKVCKIPTYLFLFINYCKVINKSTNSSSGWNNLHKNYISKWYNEKNVNDLLYLVTKYANRNGYTHRDVLRLSHVKPKDETFNTVFKYIVNGIDNNSINFISDYENLKKTKEPKFVIEMIKKHNFVREHIPTSFLSSCEIWTALLDKMPLLAMLRTLNKMTQVGVFENSKNVDHVIDMISNDSIRKKAKIHPMQILISLKMYSSGHGDKGSLSWNPNQRIVDCLDEAFYASFKEVQPTGKKILICLDVSGSMTMGSCVGSSCIMPLEVGAAMSMIWLVTDKNSEVMAFTQKLVPLNISPRRRLDDNLNSMRRLNFGRTDISLPFTWALQNKKKYDAFIVITDNETNYNTINPIDALYKYKEQMNLPDTKLIVMATSVTDFSIANGDHSCLDICGFDASVPDVINDFIRSA